jgi:hypothetical protein
LELTFVEKYRDLFVGLSQAVGIIFLTGGINFIASNLKSKINFISVKEIKHIILNKNHIFLQLKYLDGL